MRWLSLVPAIITIILTFKTKKLIPSLFVGVLSGTFINSGIIGGIAEVGKYMVEAVTNKESCYTLFFLIAFGSLAELIEMSGGISGFSEKVGKWVKTERGILGWAWALTLITFFDCSFHTIAVGSVMSPILEKVKGSKERFAFILSITSRQIILLVPIATAYLGYMVTLVANNIKDRGITENAYTLVIKSFLWNFFAWIMIFIAAGITIFGLGFGRFRIGKAEDENKEFTKIHIENEKLLNRYTEEYPKNSRNLIIPVLILLISTIFFFWWTGKSKSSDGFIGAISSANFSVSILSGVIFTIFITSIYFLIQKISLAEIEAHIVKGGENILSLVIILVLSWALTSVTQDLGFNRLIDENLVKSIPKMLIPAMIFLLTGTISYVIGSSWATWALIMPVAINFSINSGINISMIIGTVWAGGAVSEVISPLSARMANISYGDHLVTSFPYLLAGAAMTTIAYLLAGLFTL
ncbi:Na+/H+ antiporter NhaC family protein [Clostridium oryzae]|uniref:Na+/H+ antiporter family protein n=1 Tax=Clostridium oryzae TaxID=1450648 RepID=A0A1V4IS75_9CLOT|nr:Na+/H+ antiporter NhaC family protein [Clostridium oryzae]OPJ62878.1 Na+/H+ antiporter family protein [Clostridium oryzae]